MATTATTFGKLASYLSPFKVEFIVGVSCFFLAAAIEPLIPALFKELLDKGFKGTQSIPLWVMPLVVIGLFSLRGLLTFCGTYLFNSSTSKAVLALRTDMLGSIIRADASLYNSLSPSVAASKVINDPQGVVGSLGGAVITILKDGTTLVAMLGYLFYLNWRLTLISFVVTPLLALVVKTVQKRVLKLGTQAYEAQLKMISIVDDVTRAWRVVRTFDAGDFERQRFNLIAQKYRRMSIKNIAAGATMTPLTQVIASIGVAIILTMALVEANQGKATVGEFVAFIMAMLLTISPMKRLTDVSQPIVAGLIGARACFDLIDTPPEPDLGNVILDPKQVRGHLSFDLVTVRYGGSEHIALNRLTLDIPSGQTIALVGPSGSGKTTTISTLLGFVTPSSGRVALDGTDIQELRKASLRRQFAVVSQDIVLFDGSIADNVAYVQPKDAQRIEECLKAANLWEFVIKQPDRENALIGANGSMLSGGQRQRLAIARALYKDAKIWVFDEATSALDSESERVVQQSIDMWHGQRTLILIAHRLSTVKNADRIYVLVDGSVIEQGTHVELMDRQGMYASMVSAQAMS